MRKSLAAIGLLAAVVCACVLAISCNRQHEPADVPEQTDSDRAGSVVPDELTIEYPLHGAVFPPEIAAPTFRWEDRRIDADRWQISLELDGDEAPMSSTSSTAEWTPADSQWEKIKNLSRERPANVTIRGYGPLDADRILSESSVSISTSTDEVGAPLFFREVNLPFLTAVKNPALHIRWRLGEIAFCRKGTPTRRRNSWTGRLPWSPNSPWHIVFSA